MAIAVHKKNSTLLAVNDGDTVGDLPTLPATKSVDTSPTPAAFKPACGAVDHTSRFEALGCGVESEPLV